MNWLRRMSIGLATLAILLPNGLIAEPPSKGLPLGFKEWQQSGGKPPEKLTLNQKDHGCQIAMPTPSGKGFPVFTELHYRAKSHRQHIGFHYSHGPVEGAFYTKHGHGFELGRNEIVPLFDQLYQVNDLQADSITLIRVTDLVAEELRPGKKSRTISTVSVSPDLFWEHNVGNVSGRTEYDQVHIVNINETTGAAELILAPQVENTYQGPSKRKKLTLTVKKDELLAARGRAYRVINVVAPQEVSGVGKIVGWIEIAADPEDSKSQE